MRDRMRGDQWGLAIALAALLVSCSDRGPEKPARPPEGSVKSSTPSIRIVQPPAAVRDRLRIDTVGAHVVPEVITAPGEVALDLKQVAKITSRIEGQVEKIHVQLGDRVRSGQPLLAIESLRLDELVQEYLVTKAQTDVAESGYRRTEKLAVDQIVTERRLVEERGHAIEAQARHQHVREKLLNMGMTADELRELERGSHQEGHRYTLKSPIAGTVVAQNVVRGQGVSPGNELFEVVDTSRVWVFANLPIEQARKFKEGDVGTILPKGGEPLTAPLTYLAPVADETHSHDPNPIRGCEPTAPPEATRICGCPAGTREFTDTGGPRFIRDGSGQCAWRLRSAGDRICVRSDRTRPRRWRLD